MKPPRHTLFLPSWLMEDAGNLEKARHYSRLWWRTVLLTSAVAIAPLVIITTIVYFQYKDSFIAELIRPAQHVTSSVKRSTEFLLEERRAVVRFLVKDRSFEELADPKKLRRSLSKIRGAFSGFVDIGLIDSSGVQRSYAGPYELTGINYSDEDWFQEVRLRSEYLSDVFLGHRNFPHFVIAIQHENEDGGLYVLRATLDMEILERQIETLELQPSTDAFLINREGTLQTRSRFGGKVLKKSYVVVPPFAESAKVSEEIDDRGKSVIRGYAYIDGSPFIFVLIEETDEFLRSWIGMRNRFLGSLALGVVVIAVLVVGTSSYLVNKLRASDRKHAKAMHDLEYSNKLTTIGRLGAGVAHEINNPLAIINQKAGLFKDLFAAEHQIGNPDKYLKLIDAILHSVDRCSRITHRLLGFAKRIEVQWESIDLYSLINEVIGFLGKEPEHRNITVSVSVEQALPAIESDRGQLQQVFLNIINNALAAVDDGGKIMITLNHVQGEQIAVTISDNGPGIPDDVLPRIFEPFFSTKKEHGTGLGLSITHGIVQKLGGRLEVISDVGQGTSFTVTLPLQSPAKV